MIWTVFPIGEYENEMPQDFETEDEAYDYGCEQFGKSFVVESTDGEVV